MMRIKRHYQDCSKRLWAISKTKCTTIDTTVLFLYPKTM